ncbi:hypothetical protein KKG61_02805 [bacterium]|nr:hypothetical protein [bacterium]
MSNQQKNLDLECASRGSEIAEGVFAELKEKNKTENLLTKSLGVLQEDGVYAFFLYLASQGKEENGRKNSERKAAEACISKATDLLKGVGLPLNNANQVLQDIREKLADKLDFLLLAKQLLERTLVYARYHAKAKAKTDTDEVQ